MKPVTEHETLDHETLPKQLLGASHSTGSDSHLLFTGHLFYCDTATGKRFFKFSDHHTLLTRVPKPPPTQMSQTSEVSGLPVLKVFVQAEDPGARYCILKIIMAFPS